MRITPEFREEHVLGDGTRITVRTIAPADRDELRRRFEQLSPESRQRRFLGDAVQLSDSTLRYLTEVDGVDHVALVATMDSPDLKHEVGLGVARFIRLAADPTAAEAAVVVLDAYQRRGIGRVLLATLAEAARERGIQTFRVEVLASNAPVQHLLDQVGARERGCSDDTVVYDVPLGGDANAPVPDESWMRRLLRIAAESVQILLRYLR